MTVKRWLIEYHLRAEIVEEESREQAALKWVLHNPHYEDSGELDVKVTELKDSQIIHVILTTEVRP